MRHNAFLIIANTGLLALVVILLAGPLVLGQLLGTSQSGALGETVTVISQPQRQLSVFANATDFAQHATFNPSPIEEDLFYQTSVTFTAFVGQQAMYNGLLTLTNSGSQPLAVVVETGNLSGEASGVTAWLTLSPETHPTVTLLTAPAAQGSVELKVADAEGFSGSKVVVGTQVLEASKKDATTLRLKSALGQTVAVGDKVFLGPTFYDKALQPKVASSQVVQLAPQSRAVVSLSVVAEGQGDQQQIVLPITVRAE